MGPVRTRLAVRSRLAVAVAATVVIASAPAVAHATALGVRVDIAHPAVFPDAVEQAWTDIRVDVGSSTSAINVSLLRGDRVIATKRASPAGSQITFDGDALSTGSYTVRVDDRRTSRDFTVRVYRGWAPLASDRPTWQRCRAITWRYDARLAPRGGERFIARDLSAVLTAIGNATGLRFTRVTSGGALQIRWGDTGGADGVGGIEWTDGPGSVTKGFVTLNRSSRWAKTPGQEGRQVLLLHETAHAIGLGHVDLRRALMSPTYVPGSTRPVLGRGELRGLAVLYRPASCR